MPLSTTYVENDPDPAGALNTTNTQVNLLDNTKLGIGPRVVTITAASNVYTPSCATTDLALIAAPAANFTMAAPTGTAANGQKLEIRITSNATGRVPTWNSVYISSGIAGLPTVTLPASKTVTLGFQYDSSNSKWVLLAADLIGY